MKQTKVRHAANPLVRIPWKNCGHSPPRESLRIPLDVLSLSDVFRIQRLQSLDCSKPPDQAYSLCMLDVANYSSYSGISDGSAQAQSDYYLL